MDIIEIKPLEDCFDESIMKEITFNQPVTEDFIFYFGNLGKLEYFPDFPKPYFKVDVEDKFILKGILGNKTIRLILYRKNIPHSIVLLKEWVSNFV